MRFVHIQCRTGAVAYACPVLRASIGRRLDPLLHAAIDLRGRMRKHHGDAHAAQTALLGARQAKRERARLRHVGSDGDAKRELEIGGAARKGTGDA
jgi:hypothetical protein